MNSGRDWTAFDRPEVRAGFGSTDGSGCEVLLALDGIHCAGCAARAESLIASRADEIRVNVAAKTLSLRFKPETVRLSAILEDLDRAGLEPRILASEAPSARSLHERRLTIGRIGVSTICAMQVMMMAWPGYFGVRPDPAIEQLLRWAQLVISVPGVLWAGWPFFSGSYRALRSRALDMNVTVGLALAVAFGASVVRTFAGHGDLYFDTATMFVWFLTIGRYLESRTRARAGERLRLLAGRRALTAQRRSGSGVEQVAIGELRPGDEVVVAPGEVLPADGMLTQPTVELDESLLTGEARPVLRNPGQRVLAGAVNLGTTALVFRADRLGSATVLAQITRLMEHAQDSKPKLQQLADRLAAHFIAAVLVFSICGFAIALLRGASMDQAANIAIAVLVASCPCALSLAVPAALAAATSRLAASGVLVANAGALQVLARVDTVLLDKTGTLTSPEMRLGEVLAESGVDAEHCTRIAASLEQGSRHPIATAFAGKSGDLVASDIESVPGTGITGIVDGHRYWLGTTDPVAHRAGLPIIPHGKAGDTWIVLRDEVRTLAAFSIGARIRPEAVALIADLERRGLAIEILSGDGADAVEALAGRLKIRNFAARQTPSEKLARLRQLQAQGRKVLAVGDGINDAPLLAAADVAAAMPRGAALTQGKADLLLLGDTLAGLPLALDASRLVTRRIGENLAWALCYNLVVLPLALTGHLSPWLAAAGMSASSLLVVGNALRGVTVKKEAGKPIVVPLPLTVT